MSYWSIYSLTPAPWGDDYRLVETFDRKEDAESVLAALERVNVSYNCYRIIDWQVPPSEEGELLA